MIKRFFDSIQVILSGGKKRLTQTVSDVDTPAQAGNTILEARPGVGDATVVIPHEDGFLVLGPDKAVRDGNKVAVFDSNKDLNEDTLITTLELHQLDGVSENVQDAIDALRLEDIALDGRLDVLEADPVTKTYVDTHIGGEDFVLGTPNADDVITWDGTQFVMTPKAGADLSDFLKKDGTVPLDNNVTLKARNVADTANIDLIKVDNTDVVIVSDSTKQTIVQGTSIGVVAATPGTGFISVGNSNTTVIGNQSAVLATQNKDTIGAPSSGSVTVATGTSNTNPSGNITITTGNSDNSDSGDVIIGTGLAPLGDRGDIILSANSVLLQGMQAKNAADPTDAQDLATKAYVDANSGGGSPSGINAEITGTNVDWAVANVFYKEVSADTTFTFSNDTNGKTINVIIKNTDTVNSIELTFPTVLSTSGLLQVTVNPGLENVYTFIKSNNKVYAAVVADME